jgi:peptidoglycan/xylan/chitin deacetylase (PgdA/CDA1 family)
MRMNYRITCIIFLVSVILFFVLYMGLGISFWWILLPIVFLKAFIIYGSANIRSNFFLPVLCEGKSGKKEIAITFDDGPDTDFTPAILSTLDEFNVKATFFVIGKYIRGREDIIKSIDSKGHSIGNHTFTHSFWIDFKNASGFREEIRQTSDLVKAIIGKGLKLFRPPYGVTTPAIAKACKALDYQVIGWNIRSLDTTKDDREMIAKRVINKIQPGAIILFHDTSSKTNEVLKQVLEYVKQNGIGIVSVNQLLGITEYEV